MGSYREASISLVDSLRLAAQTDNGVTIYEETTENISHHLYYKELLTSAEAKAAKLELLVRPNAASVVLLHLTDFTQSIEWFWAVILAGLTPAISTPLPTIPSLRSAHLHHLNTLLECPLVLTSLATISEFDGIDGLHLTTIEDVERCPTPEGIPHTGNESHNPIILMLTSGSSGNAKAVALDHEQIQYAVEAKSKTFNTSSNDVFLDWIGLTHVACLTETFLHALCLGASFVHVPSSVLLLKPQLFLHLIRRHKVTYTFAPHFFLAKLLQSLQSSSTRDDRANISSLKCLISGGEANVVEVVAQLDGVLTNLGAAPEVVKPGFGMTETCAGSVYNTKSSLTDHDQGRVFASLGKPTPGFSMRIVGEDGQPGKPNESGYLQVSGPQVFQYYYNNIEATKAAFTHDGWFVTGDKALIDRLGNLHIIGREKETINLNGVKYSPHEIEAALDGASIAGLTPSWTVVFSTRPKGSLKEKICIVYSQNYSREDIAARIATHRKIVDIVGRITLTSVQHIIPLPRELLQKSSLGKLSRAKIRNCFEKGDYDEHDDFMHANVQRGLIETPADSETQMELIIRDCLAKVVALPESANCTRNIFEFGISSLELFSFKKEIELAVELSYPMPIGFLLTTPTIRAIAGCVSELTAVQPLRNISYNPVVQLHSCPESNKAPLWCIHPGSGDVLVFFGLSQRFADRSIYGLRTKGLNTGLDDTNYFNSISEIADCYTKAIREHQPEGPYAILGYSLGSTVAFEVAKRLEATHHTVAFLGLLDSPPHMRCLIEKLDWYDVLLNVAYFLELINEDDSLSLHANIHAQPSHESAIQLILSMSSHSRLEALSVTATRLQKLTDVTNAFGVAGKSYDPSGLVTAADVFWTTPLRSVADTRAEWMNEHLVQWRDFVVEQPVRFHECGGSHSKMLNAQYLDEFEGILKRALDDRGV